MVSTSLVHVIGTVTLIVMLTIISLYVYTDARITMYTNTKRNLQLIAELVALQVKYILYANSNISQTLDYPLMVSHGEYYNIYIGTGDKLHYEISVLPNLTKNALYAVAILPDKTNYGYALIINSTTFLNKQIILSEDPIFFGSTTITKLNVTVQNNNIIIDYVIEGMKT